MSEELKSRREKQIEKRVEERELAESLTLRIKISVHVKPGFSTWCEREVSIESLNPCSPMLGAIGVRELIQDVTTDLLLEAAEVAKESNEALEATTREHES